MTDFRQPRSSLGTGDSWAPDSWQRHTAAQQPLYPDPASVQRVVAEMAKLPPLVTSWEIESLKDLLAKAAAGVGSPGTELEFAL